MSSNRPKNNFGCQLCWPSSADTAWAARRKLKRTETLVDESHFHVMILTCPSCSQCFISIFTEQIDWVDGEDPQYWIVMPLTQKEAADLSRQDDSALERQLHSLAPERKSLRHDYPKEAAKPSSFWANGISIRAHD
ncbi:hypothetical protein JW935_01260 [candidate division KSB1 bacterium]|nr:hypothetical protein [candidate division KSB1 bacterium]